MSPRLNCCPVGWFWKWCKMMSPPCLHMLLFASWWRRAPISQQVRRVTEDERLVWTDSDRGLRLTAAALLIGSISEVLLITMNYLRKSHLCSNRPHWIFKTLQLLCSHYSFWLTRALIFYSNRAFWNIFWLPSPCLWLQRERADIKKWSQPDRFCGVHLLSNYLPQRGGLKGNRCSVFLFSLVLLPPSPTSSKF